MSSRDVLSTAGAGGAAAGGVGLFSSAASSAADSDQEKHLLPRALNLEGISLGK